jgi:hypothetical protein
MGRDGIPEKLKLSVRMWLKQLSVRMCVVTCSVDDVVQVPRPAMWSLRTNQSLNGRS